MRHLLYLILAGCLFLSGCATHNQAAVIYDPYGLFSGIWHGLVFPLALISNISAFLLNILIAVARLAMLTFDMNRYTIEAIVSVLNAIASPLNSVEIIGRPNTGLFYYLGFAIGISSWLGLANEGNK